MGSCQVQPRLDDRLVLEPLRLVVLEPTDSEDFGHLDVQNASKSPAVSKIEQGVFNIDRENPEGLV